MVAVLPGCGLRRAELATVTVGDLQRREQHWVFADLIGKGGRTDLPCNQQGRPDCHKRVQSKGNLVSGDDRLPSMRLTGVAPHDLRRTCARLCHNAGGEIEQIQFLLGHESVQTTERYIDCKQRLQNAVNDRIGLEPQDG
jgi:integrase